MYNTIYPSTHATTYLPCYLSPSFFVLLCSLFFVLVFFFCPFLFFCSCNCACVRVLCTYGEVHVFVRYSNQSINQIGPAFFRVTSFFSSSPSFRFFFFRLYLHEGAIYLTDWLVGLVGDEKAKEREG